MNSFINHYPPKGIASLLSLNDQPAHDWVDQDFQFIFNHQLDAPIVQELNRLEVVNQKTMDAITLCIESNIHTFRQLLNHPQPKLEILKAAKQYARLLCDNPTMGYPRQVASILYYLCIAVALVKTDSRITSMNNAELKSGLSWCIEQTYIDKQSIVLLTKALSFT